MDDNPVNFAIKESYAIICEGGGRPSSLEQTPLLPAFKTAVAKEVRDRYAGFDRWFGFPYYR